MTRPRTVRHALYVSLSQLERAIIAFYAQTHQRDQTAVIRGMIRLIAQADEAFCPEQFAAFVENTLAADLGTDEALLVELRRQVTAFLEHGWPVGNARAG